MSVTMEEEAAREQDSASSRNDDSEPLIRSDVMRLEIEIQCNALAMVSDEHFDFNVDDTVQDCLLAFLNHKKINPRFHDVMVFRNRNHKILYNSNTLRENGVQEGDKLWLCNTGGAYRFCFNYPYYFLLAAFIVYIIMMITVALYEMGYFRSHNSTRLDIPSLNYGVVIDAGSVHTTLSVYNWDSMKINGTGVVKESLSCETNSNLGISNFALNPFGVRDYLVNNKCFKNAILSIPEELRSHSNIFLGATAGLRILNATDPKAAQMIMSNISEALNQTDLLHSKKNGHILSGSEEGILGWITSNYLSNVFGTTDNKNTSSVMGALDWGGASSQITFAVADASLKNIKTNKEILYGKSYNVFTQSHLCYGQAEALRRYFVQLVYKSFASGTIKTVLHSPCQPASGSYVVLAKDLFYSPCTIYKDNSFQTEVEKMWNVSFRFMGQSRHAECVQEIEKAFDLKLCRETYKQDHCFDSKQIPKLPSNDTKFLAFSTYWYLKTFLQIDDNIMSEEEFHIKVQNLCSRDVQYAHGLLGAHGSEVEQNSCFKGLFMHRLLTKGYNLNQWERIEFVKRVSSAEVGWTLGYMILKTNELPSIEIVGSYEHNYSYVFYYLSLGVMLLAWCFIIFACCKIEALDDYESYFKKPF